MDRAARWSRALVVVGLVVMLIGTLDPLEGSVLILPGTALMALASLLEKSRHRRFMYSSFALVAVGVAGLFGLSAVGGIGGPRGHSMWWGVLLLPYPIGWILSLVGAIRLLREPRPAH